MVLRTHEYLKLQYVLASWQLEELRDLHEEALDEEKGEIFVHWCETFIQKNLLGLDLELWENGSWFQKFRLFFKYFFVKQEKTA